MSDNIKDLDELLPEPKSVKVNGKIYKLQPAKLKDFIGIQKLFLALKDAKEEQILEALDKVVEVLKPVAPDIEEMNLSMPQLMALLEYIFSEELKNQPQSVEKKTDQSLIT